VEVRLCREETEQDRPGEADPAQAGEPEGEEEAPAEWVEQARDLVPRGPVQVGSVCAPPAELGCPIKSVHPATVRNARSVEHQW